MRRAALIVVCLLHVLLASSPAYARASWKTHLDRTIGRAPMSVAVRIDGELVYRHEAASRRIPASNEKLLMTMALFDALGPRTRIETSLAASVVPVGGVLDADLWIVGRGDPTISDWGRFGKALPFEPTRIGALARALGAAGVTRIKGRVMGSTGYFSHDWYAPGWSSSFPAEQVPLPSALTFEGNVRKGRHISDPEVRAARALIDRLEARGIQVWGRAGSGRAPASLIEIASVRSRPLETLARYMNRRSSNFFAEVLGKRLGVETYGRPGTIAKGAAAIDAWASRRGATIDAYDSSGLSYANRVSPAALTRLLDLAAGASWGDELRRLLPTGGEGTLEDRLPDVRLRAKTGTLTNISTLSGWVWLRQTDSWAEFSIMSGGISKTTAVNIENEIVRTLTRSAD